MADASSRDLSKLDATIVVYVTTIKHTQHTKNKRKCTGFKPSRLKLDMT